MAKDLFSSHPPITPPTKEEDRLSWLRLIRSARVGASTFHRLMQDYGTAAAALDALPEVARAAGVQRYQPCPADVAERELDAARHAGARMLCHGTDAYPAALAAITDPPPVLWAIGDLSLLGRAAVALVGARNASSLGTRMARRLSEGLGHQGFCIVSGLARGVDASAHRAALETGTIAVMAGGVDMVYPTENLALYDSIAESGLLLSEQPMGVTPQARHFPRRNRIVSGLSQAVVVVEAAEKSGTLITARDALDQGRELMAVPGHPVDGRAAGCNRLIREGATLVRGVDDIVSVLSAAVPEAVRNAGHRATASQSVVAPFGVPGASSPGSDDTSSNAALTARAARVSGASRKPSPADKAHAEITQGNSTRAGTGPNSAPRAGALRDRILTQLGPSPLAEDQLIRDLARPAAQVIPELVALELEGAVHRHPGGLVSRA